MRLLHERRLRWREPWAATRARSWLEFRSILRPRLLVCAGVAGVAIGTAVWIGVIVANPGHPIPMIWKPLSGLVVAPFLLALHSAALALAPTWIDVTPEGIRILGPRAFEVPRNLMRSVRLDEETGDHPMLVAMYESRRGWSRELRVALAPSIDIGALKEILALDGPATTVSQQAQQA